MIPDHYQALGVQPQAGRDEIRAAYLRLMREHHPDHRPDDPVSAERARLANDAWHVLGSGTRRASYDRLRAAGSGRGVAAPRPRRPADALGEVAYSDERAEYRAAFSRACLRIGLVVCLLGVVLLLALGS